MEHPWSPRHKREAERIVREKLHPSDRSSELPYKLRRGRSLKKWDVKASGQLAQRGLEGWLASSDSGSNWPGEPTRKTTFSNSKFSK